MDLAHRYEDNPIITPNDILPSREGWQVICVLNPGAFTYQGQIGLLIRVAEQPHLEENQLGTIIGYKDRYQTFLVSKQDRNLEHCDPRVFTYKGKTYLTTLSHLRLAWSQDGVHFHIDESPTLLPETYLESYGIEDPRVTYLEGVYYITYTAVSNCGVAVGLRTTTDWERFHFHGIIIPPHNKDCALFDRRINGKFACLHRPSGIGLGGHYIWYAESLDGVHWGNHQCVLKTRNGMWDEQRVGAGAAPIWTEEGWLEIYHGANRDSRYCLGAVLLHPDRPWEVLARSQEPIMEPSHTVEQHGFFGNVVFSNGHVLKGDQLFLYYGASDQYICMAKLSLHDIMNTLQ